ncbi:unnamed protein product [Sphagnum jensenii]|uniref:ATPase AAA-type core domain-containing protein n=1 Tax=Sphagnum jensenii TaxID=128206 RepID=A0ABP0VMA4_9BRYO
MDSEMEISGVVSSGIAPVISVKTFLPGTSVMAGTDVEEEDLYTRQKLLQWQLEFVDIQEEAQEEVKRTQSVPLVIGQFIEMVDQNNGIVGSTTGSNYYVRILSTINRELLKPSSSVALHRHSNALVDILPSEADSSISLLSQSEKPDVTYSDIGGYDIQKQEIHEAVELPLTHHELYKQISIDPPEEFCFGSEFVQKYLGEEVPRILMELLNQMDGFDQTVNVKVIVATNRADTLESALLRPGRLDRNIEFPLPDRRQKCLIFQVCTAKMNLSEEVDLEDYVSRPNKISAAENRYVILPKDFEKGYRSNVKKSDTDFEFYR